MGTTTDNKWQEEKGTVYKQEVPATSFLSKTRKAALTPPSCWTSCLKSAKTSGARLREGSTRIWADNRLRQVAGNAPALPELTCCAEHCCSRKTVIMLPAPVHRRLLAARVSRLWVQEVQGDGAQLVLTPFTSCGEIGISGENKCSCNDQCPCSHRALALSLPKARQRTLPASCRKPKSALTYCARSFRSDQP